jgi:hypothetical protein
MTPDAPTHAQGPNGEHVYDPTCFWCQSLAAPTLRRLLWTWTLKQLRVRS